MYLKIILNVYLKDINFCKKCQSDGKYDDSVNFNIFGFMSL